MKKGNSKAKSIIAAVSVLGVIGISGVIAYFTDTTTVTNHITMGIVDIDLKEYTINEAGEKVEWADKTNVTPGEVISKIPEINCVEGAVDCYVRAKVEINCKDENLQTSTDMLTLDDVKVNEDDWYFCEQDGYFYHKEILTDKSEPVVLFSEVKIPEKFDNEWSLEEFSIDVTAEAIQSKNFTPDFSEDSLEPWPGITESDILECIYPDHVK